MNANQAFPVLRLLLTCFSFFLSGCAQPSAPAFPVDGGILPLEVENQGTSLVEVTLRVLEPFSDRELVRTQTAVGPTERLRAPELHLDYGEYGLVAEFGQIRRETHVQFSADTVYFRFVIENDAISFRSG